MDNSIKLISLYRKFKAIEYFLNKIKNLNTQIDTFPPNMNEDVIKYELLFNAEAFFFEIKSFLDILIKFITNTQIDKSLYFNLDTLKRLKPQDSYIKNLKKYLMNGIEDDPNFSLEKFNEYRNTITHGAFFIYFIKIWSLYKTKIIDPLDKNSKSITITKHLVLPDNPKEDYDKWATKNGIELVPFCIEICNIIKLIIEETNKNMDNINNKVYNINNKVYKINNIKKSKNSLYKPIQITKQT